MDPDPRQPGTDPGSGPWKMIRILADPDPQHCSDQHTDLANNPDPCDPARAKILVFKGGGGKDDYPT
jgi:hypothetical protein